MKPIIGIIGRPDSASDDDKVICAGMQLMARADNNKIGVTDNVSIKNETVINHHQRGLTYVHDVDIIDNTLLKDIIKEPKIKVNSQHSHNVTKLNEYKISAYSEEGLIEAIEHPEKRFALGIQWHPEKNGTI